MAGAPRGEEIRFTAMDTEFNRTSPIEATVLSTRPLAVRARPPRRFPRALVLYGFVFSLLTRSTGISVAAKKSHGSIDFS